MARYSYKRFYQHPAFVQRAREIGEEQKSAARQMKADILAAKKSGEITDVFSLRKFYELKKKKTKPLFKKIKKDVRQLKEAQRKYFRPIIQQDLFSYLQRIGRSPKRIQEILSFGKKRKPHFWWER